MSSTLRKVLSHRFAVLDEETVLDPDLSLAAKGLLAVLMVYEQNRSPLEHRRYRALDHVSKSVLREAMRELLREGLVEDDGSGDIEEVLRENGGR